LLAEVSDMPSITGSNGQKRKRGRNSPLSLRAGIIAFAICATIRGNPCFAAEPQASFTHKNGWVEVALCKDGMPVANATIDITNPHGINIASGEVEKGQAGFPLPPGASFVIVEIKIGEKTADPIRLYKHDAGVEPARVLLSYGLRPCCRSIKTPREGTTLASQGETPPVYEEPTPWSFVFPAFAGMSIVAVAFYMIYRR
jgi:hypothetical protein